MGRAGQKAVRFVARSELQPARGNLDRVDERIARAGLLLARRPVEVDVRGDAGRDGPAHRDRQE